MECWKLELCHHGIKGQRWGVRRFQNIDGSRTSLGRNRVVHVKTLDGIRGRVRPENVKTLPGTRGRVRPENVKTLPGTRGRVRPENVKTLPGTRGEVRPKMDSIQRYDQKNYNTHITKKSVAIGAAVVGGTVLAAYGATKYKKLVNARTVADAASAYSKVASGVSKAAVSRAAATKASTAASTVAKTASMVTSTAKKAASTAKSASKPILTLSGNDAGFSQADMDRMLDNLGKMSDLARSGQDIVRNL